MERLTGALVDDSFCLQLSRYLSASISKAVSKVEDSLNCPHFVRIDLNVIEFFILFSQPAILYQLIAIRRTPTPKAPFLYDLSQSGFGSDRGFDALARCLPVANVIHELKVEQKTQGTVQNVKIVYRQSVC